MAYWQQTPAGRDMPSSSPEPVSEGSNKKEKLPDSIPPTSSKGQKGVVEKKRTHNVVEKRYRQNLNHKIAALRDSIPALRATSHGKTGGDTENDSLEGLLATHRLNKATVLSKAIEYIQQLEEQNRRLADQCEAQQKQIDALIKRETPGRISSFPNVMNTPNLFSPTNLGGDCTLFKHLR